MSAILNPSLRGKPVHRTLHVQRNAYDDPLEVNEGMLRDPAVHALIEAAVVTLDAGAVETRLDLNDLNLYSDCRAVGWMCGKETHEYIEADYFIYATPYD